MMKSQYINYHWHCIYIQECMMMLFYWKMTTLCALGIHNVEITDDTVKKKSRVNRRRWNCNGNTATLLRVLTVPELSMRKWEIPAVLSLSQLCNVIAEEGSWTETSYWCYSMWYIKCLKELVINSHAKHSNEPVQRYIILRVLTVPELSETR